MSLRSIVLLLLVGVPCVASLFAATPPRSRRSPTAILIAEEQNLQATPPEEGKRQQEEERFRNETQDRLLAAYQRAGTKDPKWNDGMQAIIREVARLRSGAEDANRKELIPKLRTLDEAGCIDPLFRYFNLRYGRPLITRSEQPDEYRAVSKALRDSDYDSIEKFGATFRAAKMIQERFGVNATNEVSGLRQECLQLLLETLKDARTSHRDVAPMVSAHMAALDRKPAEARDAWKQIEPLLIQNWASDPRVLLERGVVHIDLGWMARGGGYADTVTDEGAQEFQKQLRTAQDLLVRSWVGEPAAKTALQMMRVEQGQGLGRERMELWFSRAMELNPTNIQACEQKLWYLMPRWYGEHADMLRFGRECLTNAAWKGEVPLTLLKAHENIVLDVPKEKRSAYWKSPAVWADVRTSFERFFEVNPKDVSWRHNYAKYAWRAQDWDELNRQIPLLGEINYSYFGGKKEFERMLQEARSRHGNGP